MYKEAPGTLSPWPMREGRFRVYKEAPGFRHVPVPEAQSSDFPFLSSVIGDICHFAGWQRTLREYVGYHRFAGFQD